MKYTIALIVGLLLIAACGGNAEVIKIGFVEPLTGDNAVFGEPANKAALLAIEEINAAGGVNGKMLQLIPEDGGCKGEVAAKAGNKLITVDKVYAIVGGGCSSETLAIAPIAEQNKVVLFSPTSSNPSITTAGDYVFRSTPSDQLQGNAMAEHLISRGIKNAAIIYANSDYNIGLKNAFEKRYGELGGKAVSAESYEQESRDFRAQLTKIKAANPGALYVISYAEGGLLLKQARELGLNVPYVSGEVMGDKKIVAEAAGAAEGLVYATPKFDPENPKSAEFLTKYRAKYGEDPGFPSFTLNAYDNVYLIAQAIEENGESADGIKDYLYTVKDYDGAGGKLTIDENGDAIKEFQLMTVKNGELIPYEESKAEQKPVVKEPVKIAPPSTETVEAPVAPPKPSKAQKVVVSVREWDMQPGESYVKPGEVALQVVNRGSGSYSVEVIAPNEQTIATTKVIEAGASDTVEFTVSYGVYDLYEVTYGKTKDMHSLLVVQ